MDYYFLIITMIDVFSMGIMCVLTRHSDTLNTRQRRCFMAAFLLILAISALELVSVLVNDGPAALRWVNFLSNYLGFGLSPAVAILLAAALDRSRSTKYAAIFEGVYLLFLAVTLPLKLVFFVDRGNHYTRGKFFFIYLICYFASLLYLLFITIRSTRRYQSASKNSVYYIAAFLLAGTIIQVVFPRLHVTWLFVTLISMLFFVYCNSVWQQLDNLTGLFNQNSYLNRTASLSQGGTLLIFDVDDFKQVNDKYGHLNGDKCLQMIAACMKRAYFRDGLCYRVGGDEFCVLLQAGADAARCNKRFLAELSRKRKELPFLPFVSVGTASFAAGDNILNVKEAADQKLYQAKYENKEARLLGRFD